MDRRQFLRFVGVCGASAIGTVGTHRWVVRSLAATASPKGLIVIFGEGELMVEILWFLIVNQNITFESGIS